MCQMCPIWPNSLPNYVPTGTSRLKLDSPSQPPLLFFQSATVAPLFKSCEWVTPRRPLGTGIATNPQRHLPTVVGLREAALRSRLLFFLPSLLPLPDHCPAPCRVVACRHEAPVLRPAPDMSCPARGCRWSPREVTRPSTGLPAAAGT